MLVLKWIVLCKRALVAQDSNLISLIECLDGIVLAPIKDASSEIEFPVAAPVPFSMAINWGRDEGDPERYRARVNLINTEGELEYSQDIEVDFAMLGARSLKHRTLINFPGLNIHGNGTQIYAVEVELNGEWVEFGRQFLTIEVKPSAEAGEVG